MDDTWKSEYAQLIASTPYDDEKFARAVRLKNGQRPSSLFKYQRYSEKRVRSLANGQVYLGTVDNFNDPYDTRFLYDPGRQEELVGEAFNHHISGDFLYRAFKYIFGSDTLSKAVSDETRKLCSRIQGELDRIRSIARICCFSERRDSMAMWAHYTDRHTGFCVEYDIPSVAPFELAHLFPVVYLDEILDYMALLVDDSVSPPTIRLNNTIAPIIAACCKSLDWSYEREWRLVLFGPDSPFVDMAAKAVYIGSRAAAETREVLRDVCTANGLEAYSMVMADDSYRMTPTPMP